MPAHNTHIVLLGSCSRYSTSLQQHLGSEVTQHSQEKLPKRPIASAPHALYVVELSELMAATKEERLELVANGIFHGRNLLLLDQGKLLHSLPQHLPLNVAEVLGALFLYRKINHRNPIIPQLWQQLMADPVILSCQRSCVQTPPVSQPMEKTALSDLLALNLHLIQESQERIKGLLQQLAPLKVVSWEARSLLDTANALLMANSYLAMEAPHISLDEETEYHLLVQQTLCDLGERLSAALFRYNESLAFYWFFTGQKIQLQEPQSLVS